MSFTLASWLPSYYVDTFDVSLGDAGLYSVLSWVAHALTTVGAGIVADRMIENGRNRLAVRKLLVVIGFGGIAISAGLIAISPGLVVAVYMATLLIAALGVCIPGYLPGANELYPEHGEVLYGIMAACASVLSIVVVTLTGYLLDATDSYAALYVFIAAISLVTIFVFVRFASVEPVELTPQASGSDAQVTPGIR